MVTAADPTAARSGPPAKAPTGIPGLDEITLGGLPEGRVTVVLGGAGTGKTVLALETLARGTAPGIFVAFEEGPDQIRANVAGFRWADALEDTVSFVEKERRDQEEELRRLEEDREHRTDTRLAEREAVRSRRRGQEGNGRGGPP